MDARLKNISLEELINALDRVAILYRVKADEVNKMVIVGMLLEEYPNYYYSDFKDAFSKHCAGKFSSNEPKPFGDLSAMFICRVLNEYLDYKRANYTPEVKAPAALIAAPIEEDILHYNFIKQVITETKKEPLMANYTAAFRYLESNNLLTLSTQDKYKITEQVIAEITSLKKIKKAKRLSYEAENQTLNTPELIKYECRKKAVLNYIKNTNT